jgi:EpsI family protein
MSAVLEPPQGRAALAPGRSAWWQRVAAIALMLGCMVVAGVLKPDTLLSSITGEPDLEAIVPREFGDWVLSPYGAVAVVNPQLAEAVQEVYTSTLARAYIHKPSGRVIMLSLAYGNDQSRDTQLHRPEMCYGGSGFRIERLEPVNLRYAGQEYQATRMFGVFGTRREPVTYMVRYGDTNVRLSLQMNLTRMRYALQGVIVDGMLFRVSEVTRLSEAESYRLHDEFIEALLSSVTPAQRAQLVGTRMF